MSDFIFYVYMAGVVNSLSITFGGIALFCATGCALTILVATHPEEVNVKFLLRFAVAGFFSLVISVVIPKQDVFYILAASSAAETTIETDIGKKALTLLEQKLDEALEVQ